jgi:hypothetical protein
MTLQDAKQTAVSFDIASGAARGLDILGSPVGELQHPRKAVCDEIGYGRTIHVGLLPSQHVESEPI